MRRQLTEIMIKKLSPSASGRLEIFDAIVPALAVRVSERGAKSFVVRSRVKGWPSPIRVTLGNALAMKLRDARQEASDMLRACRAGIDPRETRRAAQRQRESERKNSFVAVAEDFIATHVSKLRNSTATEARIRRYLIGPWGNRPISGITRDDVGERIRAIVDEGKPQTAALILGDAKLIFRWATGPGRSRLANDPCSGLSAKKDFDIVSAPRQMALSADFLRLLWTSVATLGDPLAPFFQLLLLSGQRRGEVAEMTWGELDLDHDQVWVIPATRMKAKRPHEVPLSPTMLSLLLKLRERRTEGQYIFSTTSGARPINNFTKAKRRLDRIITAQTLGIGLDQLTKFSETECEGALPAWTMHDIRRAVRTGLGAIPSVPHDIRELVIARVPPTLVQTYDLHGYREEKRQALTLWSERLARIVEGAESIGSSIHGF